jgi:hypothetical protein
MLASLTKHRKERDDQGKTRKKEGTEKEGNTKRNQRSEKKREIPGNPSVLNLLGIEWGIEKFLTLESDAIQIFILEDPKGRNAKQNS